MSKSVEQTLKKAKRHEKRGEGDLAAKKYQSVLEVYPNNQRALSGLKALRPQRPAQVKTARGPTRQQFDDLMAFYKRGELKQALQCGESLLHDHPKVPTLLNFLGAVKVAMGQEEQAVASYKAALRLEPDYVDAHNNLGNAFRALGRFAEAVASYQAALQITSNQADIHNNLGNALNSLGRHEEALTSIVKALEIEPAYPQAHNNLGNAFNGLERPGEAVTSYLRALQLQPEFAEVHSNLARSYSALGRPREAVQSYQKAVEYYPDAVGIREQLASTLRALGDLEGARSSYASALRLAPQDTGLHLGLSAVKHYQADDPQIPQLVALLEQPDLSDSDRINLHFALAKAFDDVGDYDSAFPNYVQANALQGGQYHDALSSARAFFEKLRATFSAPVAALDASTSNEKQQPIFIVGMPRSGTSLVEQILASHSQVYGAGELKLLARTVFGLEWGPELLTAELLRTIRREYLTGVGELGAEEAWLTDKMPFNFQLVGFICSAIPEAKIVHVHRDPRATCWSNFKHYFTATGNSYSRDLGEIAEFYKMYVELMAFWNEKFPGRIIDVDYELLTEQQELETRRLVEEVGLDWEDGCLDFQRTERAVYTFSAEQVRRKMYKGSSNAWRNYEKHLGPMLEVLDGKTTICSLYRSEREYRAALDGNPADAAAHNNLGIVLYQTNRSEQALACFRAALLIEPDSAATHKNLGMALKSLGRLEEAVASLRTALAITPESAEIHRILSASKTYEKHDVQLQQMLALAGQPKLLAEDRIQLGFALFKALADCQDYDGAFAWLAEANRLRSAQLNYDAAANRALFTEIKKSFAAIPAQLNAGDIAADVATHRPLFVLGMPRSGTTLVEQILANHSQVYGAGELSLLGESVVAAEWHAGEPLPDLRSIRKVYLAGIESMGVTEPWVTDKMPGNFLWIGFILSAMPEAKIVHVVRDSRATCWSNFKSYFSSEDTDYAYDLKDLAGYYRMYEALMAHWHQLFPGRIHDVHYELLTENQEGETRNLLDYIGLDWQPQCLDFKNSTRPVRTASAAQVRQTIYQGSSEEWRRYEQHLAPMLEILSK